MKSLTENEYEKLCIELLRCEHEADVIVLLDKTGFDLADDSIWHALGDNPGNFTTIGNQQEEGTAAAVEKLINCADAILIAMCHKFGIDPESVDAPKSMKEAIEKFFNVKDGRLDFLSKGEQTNLADNIHFIATGSKNSPCYSIVDKGEGQTPNQFKNTFLSTTNKSPKIKIPFVQGKYNAGSTGSFQFCGTENIQLIISKRDPECPIYDSDDSSNKWGFTVVRRRRPKESGERSSVFVYLAPNGEIPSFTADKMQLLPSSSAKNKPGKPYSLPLESGTCVKLYNYKWPGKSTATLEARRELEKCLQIPCLPFRIHETRGYKANYYANTVLGIWNEIREEKADPSKSKVEDGFPADMTVNVENIGSLPMKIVVWKKEEDIRNRATGVFFLVNGQVHGVYKNEFQSRLGFGYIKDHILIAIDATGIKRDVAEDLFMPSRDRMRQNEAYDKIRSELLKELREHEGLKELNEIWRQRIRDEAAQNNDNVISIFNELLKNDPNLSRILGFGGQIKGGVGPGKPKLFEGKDFPEYFRIANEPKKGLVKKCPINRSVLVTFETDANNDYFSRPNEPGSIEVSPDMNLVESSKLWNGRFNVKFMVPWDANVGDVIDVKVVVDDVTRVTKNGSFVNNFKLEVLPEDKMQKKKSGDENLPSDPDSKKHVIDTPQYGLPDPIPVKKEDWAKHKFDSDTQGMRIVDNGDKGFDFFWNADNKYLINELRSNKKDDPELITQWFKWGLTLAALGMIRSANMNNEEELNVDDIGKVTDSISMVILTIVKSLHDLPLNKLSN
ncbi:MAG: hypothetical protein WDZ86_03515 [Gammaproteobacteria bacterium]